MTLPRKTPPPATSSPAGRILRTANNVTELLRSHPVPLALLVAASAEERDEQEAAERIHLAAAPPVELTRITFPGGGHNTDSVRAQLPTILGWLGARLPAPIAPDNHPAGARTEQPGVPLWNAPGPTAAPG